MGVSSPCLWGEVRPSCLGWGRSITLSRREEVILTFFSQDIVPFEYNPILVAYDECKICISALHFVSLDGGASVLVWATHI